MRLARTGYGLRGQRGVSPAWVDGWMRTPAGWHFQAVRRQRDSWATELIPAARMLNTRIFEPMTPTMKVIGSENRPFEIADLSALSPLLEPRDLLGRMLPGAPLTSHHAIYVAETSAGRLYLPALLLIERLWLWSKEALRAILTPNSLDVHLGTAKPTDSSIEVTADPQLVSRTPTDTALQRVAWLIQSSEARISWSSVLTSAYHGRIDLTLPTGALSGWMWGVELPSGFMACEIMSMRLHTNLWNRCLAFASAKHNIRSRSSGLLMSR
jgi:hypothetical protein